MTVNINKTLFCYFSILVLLCVSGTNAFSQDNFCSGNWSNGSKASFRDLREVTMPAVNQLTVDGKRNGGISVKGENRNDILVRACVQTWGADEAEAQSIARNIRIETGSVIRAENAADASNGSVSYQILVPRGTNLKLTAHNGGISVSSVEGMIEFETQNGGVSLKNLSGDVKGRTQNGGVNVSLSGAGWRGNGLDVETKNGGVHLSIPENYAARIETGTVNGGFKSDIPALDVVEKSRTRNIRINTDLNGGGAPIRVVTTNGGIKISSSNAARL